jgi:hypothetical protein
MLQLGNLESSALESSDLEVRGSNVYSNAATYSYTGFSGVPLAHLNQSPIKLLTATKPHSRFCFIYLNHDRFFNPNTYKTWKHLRPHI